MAFAGPVWGQTITAPGLVGQPACAGTGETDDLDVMDIRTITSNSAVVQMKVYNNLYSELRSRSGDGGITSFNISLGIYDAGTGSRAFSQGFTINSAIPNLGSSNQNSTGLSPNTPYYAVVSVQSPSMILERRCFMTGGTYTPSNESGQDGYSSQLSSGCFSISPRTFQDIRNCLCGRSRIWTNDAQNTAQRRTLGCADAN